MDEVKQYKTAGAFRTALETRLQTRAQVERTDLQRLRRQVAFDRFLARLFPKGKKEKHVIAPRSMKMRGYLDWWKY